MFARLRVAAAALLFLLAGVCEGQTGGAGAAGGPGYSAVETLPPAATVTDVDVVVLDAPEDLDEAELVRSVREALAVATGSTWDPVLGASALARVRSLPSVRHARIKGIPDRRGGGSRLMVYVRAERTDPIARSGVLARRRPGDFPVLYRDDQSYLRFELSGGHGLFSDGNPWFGQSERFTAGNPLVQDPAVGADTGNRASWAESTVQLGVSGVTALNRKSLYGFASLTGVGVVSKGQDIFRDDSRESADIEKAYVGVVYAPEGDDVRLKLSVGRQNYTLNTGFLVSQFGSQWNAGPRPGVYLAPRTAQDMAVVASASFENWKGTLFALDPNELGSIESDTRLLGLNLARATSGRWSGDVTAMYVPRSKTSYRSPDGLARGREGLWTLAGHLRMRTRSARPDFWFEAELAHQDHEAFDMSAWAGYAELGYFARTAPWSPSLSYRLAGFSGDDPDTSRYERFDTLYSGGLDHWLQGISINKLLTQANRISHRMRFNVAPLAELKLTVDLYRHVADERNNLGGNPALGTLQSRDLGDEVQLTARWQLRPNVLVLGIASSAFPGEAIEAAAFGDADPWNTLQLQIFWGL